MQLGAEFFGTMLLTLVAAGADIVEFASAGTIGHVARYVAPGIIVMAMIWSLSGLSGAHINPAVSIGFFLRGAFPLAKVPAYVGAQLAGAATGAFALRGIFGELIRHGTTEPKPPFGNFQAFCTEAMLTSILLFVILATADQKAVVGKNAALAVGGVVAMCGLAFSPVSGASMNPARSFGPMIASAHFEGWWIYSAGPLIGAAIAVAVAHVLLGAPGGSEREAAEGK